MIVKKTGQWTAVRDAFGKAPEALRKAVEKSLLMEGEFMRTKIVEGLRDQAPGGQAFQPLAPTTIAVRRLKGFRGTKALLKRGDLKNSIAVTKEKEGVFIGVHRTVKGPNGRSMVDIAEVHEFGSKPIVVQITPAMRRLLMAAFRKAKLPYRAGNGTGIIVTKIPARPFLQPVFEKYGPQSQERMQESLTKFLSGVLAE